MNERIEAHLIKRAAGLTYSMMDFLNQNGIQDFRIAGNSMNPGIPNDVDLFPVLGFPENIKGDIVFESPNATTVILPATPRNDKLAVQLCRYEHDSLESLVRSFDFAHIQVGAQIDLELGGDFVADTFWTPEYVEARTLQTTWFTGSEYPLSSLIRLNKYYARGDLKRGAMMGAAIDILTAVVVRGFDGYDDFKDQLDAVDLGLVAEDIDEIEWEQLLSLFEALNKGDV